MKKTFRMVAAILVAAAVAGMFTGCSSKSTEITLVERDASTDYMVEATIDPTIEVWVDRSISIGSNADKIEKKALELCKDLEAYGPYPFSKEATGLETEGGYTDLAAPLKSANPNTVLYIVTDGEMDAPGADHALWRGPFNNLDVHFVCLGKNEDTANLSESLRANANSFQGSSVEITYMDGSPSEVIFTGFEPEKVQFQIHDSNTEYELECEEKSKGKGVWPWWAWLLLALALLIPLLLLLWWLLTRRRNKEDTGKGSTPESKPTAVEDQEPTYVPEGGRSLVDPTAATPEAVATTPTPTPAPATPTPTPTIPATQSRCCNCCCPRQQNTAAIVAAIAAVSAAVSAIAVAVIAVLVKLL